MKRDFSDLSSDKEIIDTDYYKAVVKCFQKLDEYHTLSRFDGYCLAASDIIAKMLIQHGIDCKIIECELMVTWKNNESGDDEFTFVGFDDVLTAKEASSGKVDTHAVVITNTDIPLLIDASIAQLLPSDHPYIVERTHRTSVDPSVIAEYHYGDCTLRYFIKKNIKWAAFHNTSIMHQLNNEKATKQKITWMQKIVLAALGVGILNLIFNFAIIMHRMYYG